jgi:hypothetical protein
VLSVLGKSLQVMIQRIANQKCIARLDQLSERLLIFEWDDGLWQAAQEALQYASNGIDMQRPDIVHNHS